MLRLELARCIYDPAFIAPGLRFPLLCFCEDVRESSSDDNSRLRFDPAEPPLTEGVMDRVPGGDGGTLDGGNDRSPSLCLSASESPCVNKLAPA